MDLIENQEKQHHDPITSNMNSRILRFYRNFSRVVSGVVLAVGFLVLVGWLFNIPALTSILPGLATMKANTALGFILCGISLWTLTYKQTNKPLRLLANACAAIAVLIAVLTLGEYISNRDFDIDQLLIRDTAATSGTSFPGRMSPVTAFNLLILGSALLLIDNRWNNWLSEFLAIIALIIAGVAVIGYIYSVSSLYQIGIYASMALHTALTFVVLCLGILSARPERGLISILSTEGTAAMLARRLLPAAIGIPIVLGWLFLTGQRMGYYDGAFGISLFALSNVVIFSLLIWQNSRLLHHAEAERGQAEKALSISEQRAQALIENSWDAIALFGADGTILYGSPSTPQILGYALGEFVGRNAFELIHEEDQAFVTERMTMSFQQPGVHIPIYARVRHKNGEWRWLEGVFTNLLDEPSVQAIVNNYHDFTERKQDEDALRESEAHKSAILESALDCIITIDHQGRILEFNPAAQATFGYTRAEAIGKEMAELIIPASLREQHRRGLAKYLATGEGPVLGKRIEINGMRADGTEFPVELAIAPIKGEDPPVFTGFLRDITESKRAKGAVSASEERFRLIVDAAPSAMIVVDRDGKIDLVNVKAQELFGYRKEELLGRSIEMLVPERFRRGHPNYRQNFLAQPTSRPMGAGRDLFGLHKDGYEIPIEIGLTPYESSDDQFTLALIVDITERKQAEEKIAYQAHLLENVNDAVIGSDQNYLIRFWNQGAERIFGWKAEEVLGHSGREILRSEFINTDRETVLKILAEQGRWRGESILYRKDGSQVIMEVSSITLRDDNGMITGYVSVNRDISERKLAEDELRKNTARTQALADISRALAAVHLDYETVLDTIARRTTELIGDACSIRLVSDDGQWLEVTSLYHPEPKTLAGLREILGTNPLRTDTGSVAQIIQTGHSMLIPVISPEQLKIIVPSTAWPILEHISIHSLLTVPLRAQGGVLGTLTLTRDQPGRPYTSEDQAFLQDLADRAALSIVNARLYAAMQQLNLELEQRVAERTAALSQANSLLQMMLDHMPDQIYFKDAQSRFIRNSRSQAEALGLRDPAEAVGKSDFDFFPHAQLSYEKEQEIIRSGKPLVDEEERVVWPDGRETWVSTTKIPLPDQTGQIIGTFGISRDITERKRAEVALQKAKLELEAANKELEAFSYSVSHDLRAPLRSIDGFSQALLEDYGELLPTEGHNFLERVRSSAQRMAELIDDLLNLSKVTRASMKLVPVDLSQLAQGIAVELQRTQPERRVNINITPNLKARGDPGLLQAVLENLLNNAWKFTAKREQAEIEFGSKHENDETIYFIRDNGAGFDMAYVGKLFGAFQRLHAMTEFSGTGIGLATVQRIINRHGGRIWAEGAVDQGATFFFILPALERVRPQAEPIEKDSLNRRVREII